MAPKLRRTHKFGRSKADGNGKGGWAIKYEYPKDRRYVVIEGKQGHRSVFPKEPLDVPSV